MKINRGLVAALAVLLALLALPFALRPELEKKQISGEADRLVVVSAHNKAIRDEYERAFREYYRSKHGRDVEMDFRSPGGTSDIVRFIADRYEAEFRFYCEERGLPWNGDIAANFANQRLDSDPGADPKLLQARREFLKSDVGIGIDVFAGGGTFDQARMADRGFAVDGGVAERHPELFSPEIIPESFGGDRLYDSRGRYYGVVLSTFGICYNVDRMKELEDPSPPVRWSDLAEPKYFNMLSLADPSKSGSANKCFEIVIQQHMAEAGDPAAGWADGLNRIKRMFANTRNLSDSAGQVVRDVAAGNAAAGMAIDTYGFSEMTWSADHFDGESRIVYVTPKGGTAVSADPVQLLRGAPNRQVAEEFIDFLLSREGQLLHVLRCGVPGGPEKNQLNRPPIRRDLYTPDNQKNFFQPDYNPYESGADFIYHPEWTSRYYGLLRTLLKTIAIEPHAELQSAWRAIIAAGGPEKVPRAMEKFNALPFDYAGADAAEQLLRTSDDRSAADVAATLREWSDFARRNYLEAARLAAAGE